MAAWRKVWLWERVLKSRTTYCLRWYEEDFRMRTRAVGSDRAYAEGERRRFEYELNTAGTAAVSARLRTLGDLAEEHVRVSAGTVRPATLVIQRACLDVFCAFAGLNAAARKRALTADSCWVCGTSGRPGRLGLCAGCFAEALRKGREQSLAAATPLLAAEFVAARVATVSRATANKDVRTLAAIFAAAVERESVEKNPFASMKRLREPEREKRTLSAAEVNALLAGCAEDKLLQAFIFAAATTGARAGELLHLHVEDVDWETGEARLVNREADGHVLKSGKHRDVWLLPLARALLRRALGARAAGRIWPWSVYGAHGRFVRAVKAAGLKHATPHDLRRTFASDLQARGVASATAKALLGHASITTTEQHYTRIPAETLRAAAERLSFARPAAIVSLSYHGDLGRSEARTA